MVAIENPIVYQLERNHLRYCDCVDVSFQELSPPSPLKQVAGSEKEGARFLECIAWGERRIPLSIRLCGRLLSQNNHSTPSPQHTQSHLSPCQAETIPEVPILRDNDDLVHANQFIVAPGVDGEQNITKLNNLVVTPLKLHGNVFWVCVL